MLIGGWQMCNNFHAICVYVVGLVLFNSLFMSCHALFESAKIKMGRPKAGNGLWVKTQRAKTSENFSEESSLPRRFQRYPEIL